MSPSATSTRLPQELVDSIIDELKHDVASLRVCSLVSKPWVHRSRKHLFESVHLPTCLLRKWLERIPARPGSPLGPHHHVRSLFLQPTVTYSPFCVPERFADHLASLTQVSNLIITNSLWEEWTDAFSDNLLVTKYFGGFGHALRNLELTMVYLNMAALKAMLDVFTRLEQLLIFSPIMMDKEIKSSDASSYLREPRSIVKAETSNGNRIVSSEQGPARLVNNITLLLPPTELVVGLINIPLHCRELVLTEDCDYGGDMFNLLLNSTGPTLESLAIQNTLNQSNCSFSHFPCLPANDHGSVLVRLKYHARKLLNPPQAEDEETVPKHARVHQRPSQAHSNHHIHSPRKDRLPG